MLDLRFVPVLGVVAGHAVGAGALKLLCGIQVDADDWN